MELVSGWNVLRPKLHIVYLPRRGTRPSRALSGAWAGASVDWVARTVQAICF
jgi:hypothetical protein